MQAQSSKAQILGLANAGGDTINAVKAANEFGITKTMKLAGLLMFINDVHSLGLKATQGMYLTDSWYWNQVARDAHLEPQVLRQAKAHAVVIASGRLFGRAASYLAAVKATNTDDADKVLALACARPRINDIFAKDGTMREATAAWSTTCTSCRSRPPTKSKEPWDYYNVVETIKGEAAWTTKAESKCASWKQ